MGNVVLIPRPLPLPICMEYPPERGVLRSHCSAKGLRLFFVGFVGIFFGGGRRVFPAPAAGMLLPGMQSPATAGAAPHPGHLLLSCNSQQLTLGMELPGGSEHNTHRAAGFFPALSGFIFRLSSGMLPPRASRGKAGLFLQLSFNLEHLLCR